MSSWFSTKEVQKIKEDINDLYKQIARWREIDGKVMGGLANQISALKQGAVTEPVHGQWISLRDSRPPCDQRVLYTNGWYTGIAKRTCAGAWQDDDKDDPLDSAGHWMPLPSTSIVRYE